MKIEVISSETKDSQRTDTVKYTYTEADEYKQLGQLYNNLGEQMAKGENTSRTKAMIEAQLLIIKGYGDAHAADTSAE